MRFAISAAALVLSGCVSVSEKVAEAPTLSSYSLCEKLAVAVLADGRVREAWASELQRRGENCAQYSGTIQARQAADAQLMNITNQLQQPRGVAPAATMGNLAYQWVTGTVRYCVYDRGGQKFTLMQQNLAPCPTSF